MDFADLDMPRALKGHLPSTRDFAALGDHARLPWRFFARLHAAAGSLIGR